MTVLVTGAAGFIGFHLCSALLERGEAVIGVDNVSPYYDVKLKEARLEQLAGRPAFTFHRLDIAERGALLERYRDVRVKRVVHLAAQAGVRHSLTDPHSYIQSNIYGHLEVLELCRHHPDIDHLVYASSSSVYGANRKLPFSESDRVDTPVSLYGATKKADELMAYSYSHLYGIAATGLRFFTVYGPWGRPDMAAYIFAKAIFAGEPITVFNHGDMKRDFTYIDDIVSGVLATIYAPPEIDGKSVPHRVYNIGNHRSEPLTRFIELIEQAIGIKAEIEYAPMQPGDVKETFADIGPIRRDLGFDPTTTIDVGIPRFIEWFRSYHDV